jgi:hypothetical protein
MNLRRFIVRFGVILLTLGLLGGCQKKEEATSEQPAEQSAQPAADSSQTAQTATDSSQAAQP